mgnify:FL=1
MSTLSPVTGETSDTKVAAIFDDEGSARRIAATLRRELRLRQSQVQVLTSGDRHPGRKLEPENRGIFRTMLIAHAKLGLVGAGIGAVLFALLYASGLELVTSSPGFAAAVIISYGAVFGLMAGGLVTLRPDHDPYVHKVQGALQEGRSAVVVHAFDADERKRAQRTLDELGGETIRTL